MSDYDKYKRSSYFCLILLLLCAVRVGIFFDYLAEEPKLPEIKETIWGNKNDSRIRPFLIKFENQKILDLKERLINTRNITNLVPITEFTNGINSIFLKKIINLWLNEYDFKSREAHFNKYPHYKTTIQGLDIHFLHIVPSTNKTTIPLLLIHGFPGTFVDFFDIIPTLTDETAKFNFEIVIPSLPGYLFSESHSNFGGAQHALILKNLMLHLGYDKFFIFGHDFGSIISTDMAVLFNKNVLGLYSPLCSSFRRISLMKLGLQKILDWVLKSTEVDSFKSLLQQGAYYHFQTTLSDILGVAINDSPMGLAAYFLYTFASETNERNFINKWDGGLSANYDYTTLIDVMTLYWFSNSITTSLRSHKELASNSGITYQIPVSKEVPCSCPRFIKGPSYFPNWILRDKFRSLVRQNVQINAGNFALMGKDKRAKRIIVDDIKESVGEMISYHQQRKLVT